MNWKNVVVSYVNNLKYLGESKGKLLCFKCMELLNDDLSIEVKTRKDRENIQNNFLITQLKKQEFYDDMVKNAYEMNKHIIVEVIPTSNIYNKVKKLFDNNPPQYERIVRIERNINPNLEKKFLKYTDILETEYTFHGSKNNENYDLILKNGFDISKSHNGLMGFGIYVAKNALMSCGYTHVINTEIGVIKNMLMCRTLYDKSIDGVNYLSNSKFYCIRDNDRVYPEFIIYYTVKQ
jgi:hypothetical protein